MMRRRRRPRRRSVRLRLPLSDHLLRLGYSPLAAHYEIRRIGVDVVFPQGRVIVLSLRRLMHHCVMVE